MNISEDRRDEAIVVRLEGSLDTGTAPVAQERLTGVVDSGASLVIVDLTALDFMSSAGLRVLLATAKKLRPAGVLRLFGLNPAVREVFDVSGFSMIFPLFDDEAAALAG